jgi:hypothetical protein
VRRKSDPSGGRIARRTSSSAFQSERANAIRPREHANHRAVTYRDLGRHLEATPLDVDQQFTPALDAFPHADLEADELLPAF